MQVITESLEREHSTAVEHLKARMVELRNENVDRLETQRKAFAVEKAQLETMKGELCAENEELAGKVEDLQRERRQLTNTPSQVTTGRGVIVLRTV